MDSLQCQICNSITKTKYRNVLCCESCKAFFRRTYLKEEGIRCQFSSQCEIDKNTRKLCRACRLQKCNMVFSIKCQKSEVTKEIYCDPLGQPLPIPKKLLPLPVNFEKQSWPHKAQVSDITASPIIPLDYQVLLNHLIQVQIYKNTELLLQQTFNNK